MSSFQNIKNKIKSNPSEKNILELIAFAENMSNEDILMLANLYANSGVMLNRRESQLRTDIASTGGPTSLSTILTPLYLKAFGCEVPKLGVPGRPAGGIDILHQIDGYNISPTPKELKKWLYQSRYVHFVGSDNYTPLDRKVFEIRKKNNLLAIPPLVIASILSKKIAVNLTHAGLDIRVSPFGNFGTSWKEARKNGQRFIEVASLLGIRAKCFLTDGSTPYQPYIGRGEALLAIQKILEEPEIELLLKKHLEDCYAMAGSVINVKKLDKPNIKQLRELFEENIVLQGSTYDRFLKKAKAVENDHIYELRSNETGFLKIDLRQIRSALVTIQTNETSARKPLPDPCGIILKKSNADIVVKGEIICSFRCVKEHLNKFRNMLFEGFDIVQDRFIKNDYEEIT